MQRQLRCVIAAGGTAGHVLPALAVAEALKARGVFVTFAGSPDRVEARLVPEAGYELDTFRISGFPRKPTPALAERALPRRRRAVGVPRDPAPAPAGRRLRRRRLRGRADGARGARRCGSPPRSPRPTRTSGSRTGWRRRSRSASSSPIRSTGRDGDKYRVVGRPIPARARRVPQGGGRARSSSCRRTGRVLLVAGALAGAHSLNELVVESFAEVGPAILHITGKRDYDCACGGASSGPTTA